MTRIAVFPGSFDPLTIGHCDILERALPLFEQIIVAIGHNAQKKYLFSLEQRLAFIQKTFQHEPKISVQHYTGLTINYCQKVGAQYLLRGVRSTTDFEYERSISQMNYQVSNQKVDTIFLICQPAYTHISSTIVRELYVGGGNVNVFVPPAINELLQTK